MRAQDKETDKAHGRAGAGLPAGRVPTPGPASGILALQRAAGNAAVSRAVEEQRHQHDASCGHGPAVQRSAVHDVLRSPGRTMDAPLQNEMESRFGGEDFSGVRLHTDSEALRSAEEIGAQAYTSFPHVVWDGRDKQVLAEELHHIGQQSRGPVPGTDNGDGLMISDPRDWAEVEAKETARQVMSGPAPVQRAVETAGGASGPAGSARGAPGSGRGAGTLHVQRVSSGAEEDTKGTYKQKEPTAAEDRDVTLRMLDRMSRIALRTIVGTNSDYTNKSGNPERGKGKITPHLAVSLLPDGSLAIAGNTGDKRVIERDQQVVEAELQKYVAMSPEMQHAREKDRTKLKALSSGDYAKKHGNAPGLLALDAAMRRPIQWFAVGGTEANKTSQHGEMTVLGKHVANWLANPRDPGEPEKVMMGGVKKACRSCQWAFDAVNEHIGRPNGYEVEASGTHDQFFPGWLMPEWMRAHPQVLAAVEAKANATGVRLENGVLQGPMSERTVGHDPDSSHSEWSSESDSEKR
ncbi:DUF4157 domain-containing protein [Streptomyces sp. NPDC056437]|uniref:eCIS core domain-containing protein n=1 Tax=Streptomyces sp. NPDC056437 TaxID=3345816 RepID=UPI003684F38B